MRKNLLVGVGNIMYGDDAFGAIFAETVKHCTDKIDVINAGKNLFYIASLLSGYDKVVFVDILSEEFGKPGDVVSLKINPRALTAEEISILLSRETYAHTATPAHVVAIAYSSGSFNGDSWLIGIVSSHREFAGRLSDTAINSVEKVCDEINKVFDAKPLVDCSCVKDRFPEELERAYSELKL